MQFVNCFVYNYNCFLGLANTYKWYLFGDFFLVKEDVKQGLNGCFFKR